MRIGARPGLRYVATAFMFFILAGALAALMRLQLAVPDNKLLTPDQYNQVFTTHGVAMMFLARGFARAARRSPGAVESDD